MPGNCCRCNGKRKINLDAGSTCRNGKTIILKEIGIYPYTVVTEKQKEAMKLAGVDYTYSSLYDLTFVAAKRMLKN